MIRTQIQLETRQERAVKQFARRHGISMAEAIRRCIDSALADHDDDGLAARYDVAAKLVGAFQDGEDATEVAEKHDDYLDEAF